MDTAALKKFAQQARRELISQVKAKLDYVLNSDSAELREKEHAVNQLQKEIKKSSPQLVVEQVAYTWFNRFCALRFMDLNGYTRIGTVTPAQGFTQPEILSEAAQGHIHVELDKVIDKQQVFRLLKGEIPSSDPQQEVYRLLLKAVCNYYHNCMPFMFEKLEDYTELLMPEDLLSDHSILHHVRQALTTETCQNIEVIGWLYQFYISEKKDQVFNDLKKNKKITAENIPAATQLFTPHWIVRYLVENSLGRLWMLNHPDSQLTGKMEFYIKPEQEETDFLKIPSLKDLKICDPACGSGHMLVYAFDLLFAIYEEEGYDATEIPGLILENNLYGIEIDQRAGQLAAFALIMKAREKDRRFLETPVQPNICVLENVIFKNNELNEYIDQIGPNLFNLNLQTILTQFEEADNFGSLIRPALTRVADVYRILKEKNMAGKLFLKSTHDRVMTALEQADYLSLKYHVVIANPPYMGGSGMNEGLKKFAKDNYPESKSDLFAIFIERIMELTEVSGFSGLMTPFNWMFLSSFEKIRKRILNESTLTCLVRPEFHAFFDSAYVSICGFTLFNNSLPNFPGAFIDLNDFYGADIQPVKALEAIKNHDCKWFFRASAADFKKIPGSSIAYWVGDRIRDIFSIFKPLSYLVKPKQGLATGDNEQFLRNWYEVVFENLAFGCINRHESKETRKKWFPCNKGGAFRKWYGNNVYILNWENDGSEIKSFYDDKGKLRSRPQNQEYYFREGITWSSISSSNLSMRYSPAGTMFETKGSMCFADDRNVLLTALGFSNTKIVKVLLLAISPTLDFHEGPMGSLPFKIVDGVLKTVNVLIITSKIDWDSYETSWDFTDLPLLRSEYRKKTLKETYTAIRSHWQEMTSEMQRLEEENNRIFIEAYGLQEELTPDVPLKEITLTCNPYYRYNDKKSKEELETLLLADTMREFISYAVGCMFGRYSLDKPGLILANQGETLEDYLKQVPTPTFSPDADNVIPLLAHDWFEDDIVERFRKFLRVTFGPDRYAENLAFIEEALGKDIRKYFLTDFYTNHIKRYKKRPIYWLYSSPKASFNALIYMHRYRSDTVSVVLNDYLREFLTKLESRKNHFTHTRDNTATSVSDHNKAKKEIESLTKIITELEAWESDILFPLATQQISIDLDDGVKVNYNKFGPALKNVSGLTAK